MNLIFRNLIENLTRRLGYEITMRIKVEDSSMKMLLNGLNNQNVFVKMFFIKG